MKSDFSRFGCSQNNCSPLSAIGKQILDVIKKARTLSEKEAIVDSTSRFSLTLLFALSSSVAILRNTYDHFKDRLEDECDETESDGLDEVLEMIHYQLMKIYDLKQRCQSMERLFRNLGSRNHNAVQKKTKKTKKRRLNKVPSTEKTVRFILKLLSTSYLF